MIVEGTNKKIKIIIFTDSNLNLLKADHASKIYFDKIRIENIFSIFVETLRNYDVIFLLKVENFKTKERFPLIMKKDYFLDINFLKKYKCRLDFSQKCIINGKKNYFLKKKKRKKKKKKKKKEKNPKHLQKKKI